MKNEREEMMLKKVKKTFHSLTHASKKTLGYVAFQNKGTSLSNFTHKRKNFWVGSALMNRKMVMEYFETWQV